MNENRIQSYPYKSRWLSLLVGICLFVLSTALFGFKALNNEQALVISSFVRLSVAGTSFFYLVCSLISLLLVVSAFFLIIHRITSTSRVEITETEVHIPYGFMLKKTSSVQIKELVWIKELQHQSQCYLYLQTAGLRYCILKSMMPSNDDYEELKMIIQKQVEINKS